ncbi:MAG: DegT/DnrJ/EryC1/StrS family aminotransferase [Phycisphaerae bacterium]|nr:DegT/DnrJ/EryC1/StrS family aminotransferase [Phycisphaerae bacterium]
MTTIAAPSRASTLALHGGTPVASPSIPIVSVTISEEDIQAAVAVMRSGMMAQGKNCLALEEKFGRASEAKFALTCANGTCALQLAYEPLIKPGDEVLVPAWSYIATVSMVVARGGVPVFVDADPETYNIDVHDAAKKVSKRTTAIAATHLYGNPVNIDGVESLAAKHGLSIIYDAAQAHLATYHGKGIGAYGDVTTYSFYATKNMTTGEGGMVTTNDEELFKEMKLLRSHGETQKYIHGRVGYNYRMTDLEAAIGLSQFNRLPEYTSRRQKTAAALDRAIGAIPGLHAPKMTPEAEGVYHLYPVRIDEGRFKTPAEGTVRDEFCKALNAEGIATAIHYPRSLTRQPAFEKHVKDHPPVADRLSRTLFCVPVHHNLSESQTKQIGEALHKVAEAMRG